MLRQKHFLSLNQIHTGTAFAYCFIDHYPGVIWHMKYIQISKILTLFLCMTIAITTMGCSCYSNNSSSRSCQGRHNASRSQPSIIFDYPRTAARSRQPHVTSSEQFIRQEWPMTSIPAGYVTDGEIAGYQEYTSDYQRIGSDNNPRQYYNRRTRT